MTALIYDAFNFGDQTFDPRKGESQKMQLIDHNLLGPNLFAVDQAQYINARGKEARSRKTEVRMNLMAVKLASQHVDDLNGAVTFGDDDLAVADKGEMIVFTFIVGLGAKDQLEAGGVVRDMAFKRIGRLCQHIDIRACEVVDQMEVGER